MKAMILAAGRGERMRPLTDRIPKPLLKIGDKSLIEYHLESLSRAGIKECVINLSYRGSQISDYLGNGERWNLIIQYSNEGKHALESAGGIIQALPLLGDEPFIVLNADIWTDFDFAQLPIMPTSLAHLVMVNNPPHNPEGDFGLHEDKINNSDQNKLTYSGIGVYHPLLFIDLAPGKRPLKPLLVNAIQQNLVSGEHFLGNWSDIGTPDRLDIINRTIRGI
jgi:MurNAc alpha-1-phosphate uridylyltransferase